MNEVGILGSFLTAFGAICILVGADVPSMTYGTKFSKGSLLGFLIGGICMAFLGTIAWVWGVIEEMWENEKESRKAGIRLLGDTTTEPDTVAKTEEEEQTVRF